MADYTPATEAKLGHFVHLFTHGPVRVAFEWLAGEGVTVLSAEELAEHDRQVAEKAWDEAAHMAANVERPGDWIDNPYRVSATNGAGEDAR